MQNNDFFLNLAIQDILNKQGENTNQSPEVDMEKILMDMFLNTNHVNTKRNILSDLIGNFHVLSESQAGCFINDRGMNEEFEHTMNTMLDDGTSTVGIVVCETCYGRVKEENIRRCGCGQTCCLRKGCAKYSKEKGEWYCSSWHKFLDSIGIGLR